MINFEEYMKDCTFRAENAYSCLSNVDKYSLSKVEDFRCRYLCYLEWGMPLSDIFNKDYRVANFLTRVLEESYEYTDGYASFGWNTSDVVSSFKVVRRAARFAGYKGRFKIKSYGRRVRVYLDDVVYSIRDSIQVVETMYDIADYLGSQCVDAELSDFVGSFMHREYNYMGMLASAGLV